jgi:hypothetical protein
MRGFVFFSVLHRCCQLFSLNVPFTRRWWIFSVNPFVAFYVKGLPLEKRLAVDALLEALCQA